MARLLLVSGGIMALGLIAVFAAIVYKLGLLGEGVERPVASFSSAVPVEARIALPAGATIIAADLDGDRALLTVEESGGGRSLVLVDLTSGAILGRYALIAE